MNKQITYKSKQKYEINELSGGRLFNGDCFDVFPDLETHAYDLLLTDPPYAMPSTYYLSRKEYSRRWSDTLIMSRWFINFINTTKRLVKPTGHVLIFCDTISSASFIPGLYENYPTVKHFIWDKTSIGMGKPIRMQHELMLLGSFPNSYVSSKGIPSVYKFKRIQSTKKRHPAEKPIDLLAELISLFCPVDGKVLDPFSGSGSTLDAARWVGRKADIIEYDATDIVDRESVLI